MTTLKDVSAWLESEYNSAMSVFNYGDHVRLTNGSAAMYVDIAIDGNNFILRGERYGETITKQCNRDRDSLLDTLSRTI